MFLDNKYFNWYSKLIENIQNKDRKKADDCEYDLHHILPKSMGGTNKKTNLVLLTPREHFLAHMLLVRCVEYQHINKMLCALIWFKKEAKNSRKYAYFRATISRYSTGELNSAYGKMWCHMKEDINDIRFVTKDLYDPKIMHKGLPYQRGGTHNKKWVKKNGQQKSIHIEELDYYLSKGWQPGRNTKMNVEHFQYAAALRHTEEKDKEHSEKMKEYHRLNPRKGKKAWITDGTQNMLINVGDIDKYPLWNRGRTL